MHFYDPPLKLSLTSVEDFQETFEQLSTQADGKISRNQIGEALRALGQNPTEASIKKLTAAINEERLSFEMFLPIYQTISKAKCIETADDFIECLRHFDKDGNGYIHAAELRHILTTLGEKLNDDEVDILFQNQENNQGNINYEDFVNMVMSG